MRWAGTRLSQALMAAKKQAQGAARGEAAERRRHRLASLAREDILRAAAAAFAGRGYQEATLQQIAAAAGFTAASLYTYFPSKEAIYRELGSKVVAEVAAPFRRKLPADWSFGERVGALVEAQCAVAERWRDAFMFFMRLMERGEPVPGRNRDHGHELLELCEQWMQRNAPPSSLRVAPDDAGPVLWSVLNAFVYRWVTKEPSEPLSVVMPRIVDVFLHGILQVDGAARRGDEVTGLGRRLPEPPAGAEPSHRIASRARPPAGRRRP
jgi:AcrR family transcriptional regulator